MNPYDGGPLDYLGGGVANTRRDARAERARVEVARILSREAYLRAVALSFARAVNPVRASRRGIRPHPTARLRHWARLLHRAGF